MVRQDLAGEPEIMAHRMIHRPQAEQLADPPHATAHRVAMNAECGRRDIEGSVCIQPGGKRSQQLFVARIDNRAELRAGEGLCLLTRQQVYQIHPGVVAQQVAQSQPPGLAQFSPTARRRPSHP